MASEPVVGYRLSPRQRYLWSLPRPGLNVQARAVWSGPLTEPLFRQALRELIARHEILRTAFRPVPELRFPLQVILETPTEPTFRLVDLSNTDSTPEPESLAAAERETPFVLEAGLPVRFVLLKLAEERHVLLVTLPALCADSRSLQNIFEEVSQLYSALAGNSSPLEEPVQFIQLSEWQNDQLEIEPAEATAYWNEQWPTQTPGLRLPLQLPDNGGDSFQPAQLELKLPSELFSALNSLALGYELPLSELLFTAWQVLLGHLSGQETFSLGYEAAGRDYEELAGVIGPIAQKLPVKLHLDGDLPFNRLWQKTADKVRQAREWQQYFNPEVIATYLPINFAFQDLSRMALIGYRETCFVDRFNLKLSCLWEKEIARLDWQYNTSDFEMAEIERLAGQFMALLETIIADPQLQPGKAELNLISPAQAREQTEGWNNTGHDFGPVGAIHYLFEEQARLHPQAVAVVFEEKRLTYAELNTRSNKLAHYLTRLGVGPEKVVGICLERSLEMLVALLAVLKAGGAYLPLDPRFPAERLAYMLDNAGVEVLLTQQTLLSQSNCLTVYLDTQSETWQDELDENPHPSLQPENTTYVIYTSGSTGNPKGVMVEHRQLINYTLGIMDKLDLPVGANYATVSTIAADLGNTVIYPALCGGGCLHIISWDQMFDSTALALYFERNSIDCLKIVPSHLSALLIGPQPAKLLPRRCLVLGGESWDRELGRKLQSLAPDCQIFNHYGPTETTVGVLTYRLEKSGLPIYTMNPPLGRPLANLRIYILNKNLQPVAVGLPGEIYIGGAGVTRGYLGRPELTAEKFLPDPYNPSGSRMYKTGDQGRFLPDGLVEFLGRTDNQVKVRGFRVELGEIEQTLRQFLQVREALVVFRAGSDGEQKLVAYFVANEEYLKNREQQLYEALLKEWQQVFNETHSAIQVRPGTTFNPFGWNSSYTGEPLPEAEIRQQVDYTVRAILDRQPERVLEIGCGTGLLLFEIAPHCREYWGTDFSQEILDYTGRVLTGENLGPERVRLLKQAADDFGGLPPGYFDAVILNSVIQYFPGVDYLLKVIERAIEVVRPGGFIFLGDIRSLPLLEAFHASVQYAPGLTWEQLRDQVRQEISREGELILDPAFFRALPAQQTAISQVEISLKHGRDHNELTNFRFDVILQINAETARPVLVDWKDWQRENLTLSRLRDMLQGSSELIGISRIPNSRVSAACGLVRWLAGPADAAIEKSAQPGSDPEDLWSLGQELARPVQLSFSDAVDCMDALFFPVGTARFAPLLNPPNRQNLARPLYNFANYPLQNKLGIEIGAELRQALEKQLPDYMLPALFMLLREIPLNQNGKIDYESLPVPLLLLIQASTKRPYLAPRNPVEAVVAATWAEVLHFERVGVDDNFFELGGHSLLATQAVARLRAVFQVALPLKAFFEDPTVAGIARSMVVSQERPGQIERIAELWHRINRMSPEEVHAMLQRQKQTQAGQ